MCKWLFKSNFGNTFDAACFDLPLRTKHTDAQKKKMQDGIKQRFSQFWKQMFFEVDALIII